MKNYSFNKLCKTLERQDYAVFLSDSKPFNLNIVGVRSKKPEPNKFNDSLCVFWKHEGQKSLLQFEITTLPGLHWLEKPMNPKGCAILKPGQYRSSYILRLHRGKYLALCQNKDVVVYRDADKDTEWDMIDVTEETGMFGINIHRASAYTELNDVDRYSAGCQVFRNPEEFSFFINLCERSQTLWGENFTYTLINEEDYEME